MQLNKLNAVNIYNTHLYAFSSGGPQRPADDLLHHIWQQTGCNQQDYAQPGRTTGQHLHEHIVHPLVVEEGPGGEERKYFFHELFRLLHKNHANSNLRKSSTEKRIFKKLTR